MSEFFESVTLSFEELFETISYLENNKFENDVEYIQNEVLFIETENGFDRINGLIKKTSPILQFTLDNGAVIKCAFKHILFNEDGEITADKMQLGDSVRTKTGMKKIISKDHICDIGEVYDVEVNNSSHTYVSANGVVHHNTAITAGISHVYSQVGYKTITVVPSGDLVNQTYDWYKLAGLDTGIYSGETKDLNHSNVVATWQSLQYNPSIIEDFNVFIWDECVHPDTLITTDHGKVAIKDLKVGDLVLTIDEQDNRITAFKPIRKIFKNLYHSQSEKRYKLFFEEGGELIITGNHKVLTRNGWKRADNLLEGDIAHTSRIISIKEIDYIGDTYNLHVEDNHNYFANGIVVSNCHGATAEVARKLINDHGRNIQFRFGVTGTFPKSEVDQYNLFSSIGSIFIEIPAKWLIDHGYLAKITIEPIELQESNIEENFVDYAAEKSFLSKSLPRLEAIADLVISKCLQHGNTLVLVNSIQFGKKLSALIKDSVFLYGESSTDLRKEHYDMFETRNDVIVIASAGIASTGISIDRIFCMMLIDPGKSFVKAIQSAGRGLRKAKDKHEVVLIDVYSNLKWAKKHHRDRLKYYKEANYPVLAKQTLKLKNRH